MSPRRSGIGPECKKKLFFWSSFLYTKMKAADCQIPGPGEPMKQRRADRIVEELENLIFQGEFHDGDRLDEVRLSERFKVSRTPVRERRPYRRSLSTDAC